MRLNHNLASLNIYNQLVKSERAQNSAMGRVSSGSKISSAAENPYALSQSESQRMQIRGLQAAQRNLQDGVSMFQSIDSSLDSITSALHRIKELTIQAGGISSDEDKNKMQIEINQMKRSIEDTVKNSQFNGVMLLNDVNVTSNSNPNSLLMAAGSNSNENISIPTYNLNIDKIGDEVSGKFIDSIVVTLPSDMEQGLGVIDSALTRVLNTRSKYGALQNRFESMYNNIGETEDTLQKAESGVRDADIALEMIEYSKNKILVETGNALLVQSNNFPMDTLRILENIR